MTYAHRFMLLVVVMALGPQSAGAQASGDYCAFEVTVRSPTGEALQGITVSEVDARGALVGSALTDRQGLAKICDSTIGLVSIRVGGNRCGAVTVAYLRAYWLEPRRVSIIYKNCSGEEWAVPGGCLLTMRVKDQQNAPIAGAYFDDLDQRPKPQTSISDPFGRIFRFITLGETMSGRIRKSGYLSRDYSQACRPGDQTEREEIIVLRKGEGDQGPPK